MEREAGNRSFPIWLLGDSNPKNWQTALTTPFDPRHPVRHNIWTPILDVVQEKVFRACRSRVDTSFLYIRNAVDDPNLRPKPGSIDWGQIEREVDILRQLIRQNNPMILLCFGRFSFEFARRTLFEVPKRKVDYWDAKLLGREFLLRINQFSPPGPNLLPLLHRSIPGGKFIQSHDYFCDKPGANYFEVVGEQIANKLLQYQSELPIWLE